jgi:tetratricopeptide (TPR) repeat protein
VIPNFIKAMEYYQQLGDKKKEQIISKNIAIGYYQQGNYPKYLEYIQKALELAKEIKYEYGIRFANSSL